MQLHSCNHKLSDSSLCRIVWQQFYHNSLQHILLIGPGNAFTNCMAGKVRPFCSKVKLEMPVSFFFFFSPQGKRKTFWPPGSFLKNSFCLPCAILITDSIPILTVQNWNQSSEFKRSSSMHELFLCTSRWYMSASVVGVSVKGLLWILFHSMNQQIIKGSLFQVVSVLLRSYHSWYLTS